MRIVGWGAARGVEKWHHSHTHTHTHTHTHWLTQPVNFCQRLSGSQGPSFFRIICGPADLPPSPLPFHQWWGGSKKWTLRIINSINWSALWLVKSNHGKRALFTGGVSGALSYKGLKVAELKTVCFKNMSGVRGREGCTAESSFCPEW